MDVKEYRKLILKRGKEVINNLKNNIYPSKKDPIEIALIDYVLDTFINYNPSLCINQKGTGFIKLEPMDPNVFNSEDDYIFINKDTYMVDDDYIITEDFDNIVELEGDPKLYIFYKNKIKLYLDKLIKK